MKMLKPSPTLGRNAFDESQRNVFAINFGELLPCYCLETVPHDKIEIDCANLLRCQPMITSPFLRAKQHIDFWFVPYSMLWSRWNDFITSKSEPNSAALKDAAFVPHFNIYDVLTSIEGSSDPQSGIGVQYDVFGRDIRFEAYRLLDLLGYPSYEYFFNVTPPATPPTLKVNAWRLAAYQKIWYSEYRQKYYDDGSLGLQGKSPALMFNFDDLSCDQEMNADIYNYRDIAYGSHYAWKYLCMPRFRCWKKDLFTGLMPSTQFGAVSTVSSPVNFVQTYLSGQSPAGTDFVGSHLTSTNPNITNIENIRNSSGTKVGELSSYGSFDVLALRKSEALQKWRENALRAGNQIEDNYEAHYGVKPKSHLDTHPILIGSLDSPINIGDVDATAETAEPINGTVGSVAGKAISSINGSTLHFQTNDFGVVMGIMSILPEAEYMSTGIDRMNQLLEQFDYFVPEMENLGLEAVDPTTRDIKWYGQNALGYAPRYFGYKTKPDLCHLQFFNRSGAQGLLRHWCSPQQLYTGNTLRGLYVNYAVYNVNFDTNASDNVPNFIVDHYTKCTAIRPMSVSGVPGY